MATPTVSVILPFYNNATTLKRAVDSILRQTVSDFELIMIDDGSGDDSYQIAASIRDPRIRLYRNEKNMGVSATRNRGIELMRGEFVAPMDGDDTCPPDRLELSVKLLKSNPSLGFCGGWVRWKGFGFVPFVTRYPSGPKAFRAYSLFDMPTHNNAMMFRADILKKYSLRYDETMRISEDYDLLLRCLDVVEGDNVPAVTAHYIHNPRGAMATGANRCAESRLNIMRHQLAPLFPTGVDEETLRLHASVGNGAGAWTEKELEQNHSWLMEIEAANARLKVYDTEGLRTATALVWFRGCRNSAHLGSAAWNAWRQSSLSPWYTPCLREWLSFLSSWIFSRIGSGRKRPQGAIPGLEPSDSGL